jgi:hypothetical protein
MTEFEWGLLIVGILIGALIVTAYDDFKHKEKHGNRYDIRR